MVNDAILSGLVNLFALVGADSGADRKASEELLESYLTRHFGLRDCSSYLELYSDLSTFYTEMEVEKDLIVSKVSSSLKANMSSGELALIQLRLMEFSSIASESLDLDSKVLHTVAESFGVSDQLFSLFNDYVWGAASDSVKFQHFDGYDGVFKTLWLSESNTLIFTYYGEDDALLNDVLLTKGIFLVWDRSGVVKNHKGSPLYFSDVIEAYSGNMKAESIAFTAENVEFRFPGSDNGLHNFSSILHSGELVAVMGGSGAGKTTLLSILNGSLKPSSGRITINGCPIGDPAVKGLIGFVPQDDLLIEELTVYQNLYYTAKLCFDSLDDAAIDEKVMKVLGDLGLEASRDLIVGSPLRKTISGGQRKRLNIALELVREPLVIFLDEPTSGLSSADTENVMGLLKEQTNRGRLVVANIHQPSSDVYKLFDRVLLLDAGGYPVFDGNPIDAVTYFKTAANYADARTSTCQMCGNVNPEIVLNIINEKALDGAGKISRNRKVTPRQWHQMYLEHRPEIHTPEPSAVTKSSQKTPTPWRQMLIFLERTVKAKLTNTQYILITSLIAPVLAVICGLLTRFAPPSGYTVMDNKNMVSYLFMAIIVAVFVGMTSSAEEIIRDRTLLKREKFLNLSYPAYIFSKIIYAAAVSLVQTALFVLVGNLLMGLHGMFLMWWMILFVSSLLSNLIGLILSQTLSSVVAIYITIPLLLIPQILLCGLVVDFSDFNTHSKTDNVPVLGDVIPSRWAFEALAVGTYCYNEYEAPYFELDRQRYQALFYREQYIKELESQLETWADALSRGRSDADKYLQTIKNSLPRLSEAASIEAYAGDWDYTSISEYLAAAEKVFSRISNEATLEKDRLVSADIRTYGADMMRALKTDNCNERLEEFLVNSSSETALEVVDGFIVPKAGRVFLTPVSRNGRAPFYSSLKVVGGLEIPTLLFNMLVLVLMCLILGTALVVNIPERIKKYQ
ncbi:MAG: ATP-binding cassette domain-containing protein [Bacteroidales bacterium]|nr:ATP-binding cassette domain-containing protein [Bacteroidales bacterium]